MTSKIALITGGTKGIGYAVCKKLCSLGVHVIMSGRDSSKLRKAVNSLKYDGHVIEGLLLDITDNESIHCARNYVRNKYGHLDILVNNAAIRVEQYGKAPSEQPLSEWLKTFNTNLFGTISITNALLEPVKSSPSGRIINVSSLLGSTTTHTHKDSYTYSDDFKSLPAYSASKAALNSWCVHLAYELRNTDVIVCSIHPGYTRTDLNDGHGDQDPEAASENIVAACLESDRTTNGTFLYNGKKLPW
ncbi:SDR family oxidoreductase [Chromohalobacter israelensis]|nr:SDR family oxidoreductase [Chromohalobacter salexigens]